MIPDDVREQLDELIRDEVCRYGEIPIIELMEWFYSQPTMPQPDWSEAPQWAQWWAVDPDSIAYWFETKPVFEFGYWYCGDKRSEKAGCEAVDLGLDHRMTLQQRPEGGGKCLQK
jgi:hypothetical protein